MSGRVHCFWRWKERSKGEYHTWLEGWMEEAPEGLLRIFNDDLFPWGEIIVARNEIDLKMSKP